MKIIKDFIIKQRFVLIGTILYFLLILINNQNFFNSISIPTLDEIKEFGENIQPIIEIFALVIAGIWSYILFIKNRVNYPIGKIDHDISHWNIDQDYICLSVIISIKNMGKVLMRLGTCKIYIQQILPLHDELHKLIQESTELDLKNGNVQDLFLKEDSQIAWREIGYREIEFNNSEIKIEPGETEEFQFEFILDKRVQKVRIISFYRNLKFSKIKIGWRKTSLYSFCEETMGHQNNQDSNSTDYPPIKSRPEPERTLPFSRPEPERTPPMKEETASRSEPERTPPPQPKEPPQ